jgi:E3 ubiquitin-protein ligase ZNF598
MFTFVGHVHRIKVVKLSYQQRSQFPELIPTSIGTEYAGIAGGRVLNAKHQTSRTSRPRGQVLDRVAAAASSSSWPQQRSRVVNNFPALTSTFQSPPRQKPTSTPSRPQQKSTTPWTNNGQGSSSSIPVQTQQPASVVKPRPKQTPPPPPLSKSVFPELPTVASNKPPKEFISGNKSLRNILGDTLPAQPAWGQGPSQPSSPPPDPESEATTTKGRKGKGKQKQTLFKLGGIPS